MPCIAVTRGGFGSVLRFETDRIAFTHPAVQYGDAIIRSDEDLPDLYTWIEWPKLMRLVGVKNQLLVDALDHLSPLERRAAQVQSSTAIWRSLVAMAQDPPDDFNTLSAMVAADRTAQEPKKMTVENTDEATETKTAKSTGDFAPDTVIHYGADKDGVPWSAERCPYKPDSKRSVRWSKLRDGMTVQEAVENGQSVKNINDMTERNFITLEPAAMQAAA